MSLNRYRSSLLGLCLAAATAIACSDDGMEGSPISPSPNGSPSGGAVIAGRVNGVTASAPASETSSTMATSTLTISVVGTGISTVTDGSGRFTLTGVPAGTVQLALTGPGTNATITISGVEPGQRIDVIITIANGRARLDSENRSRGVDVVGRVTEVNASARTLRVGGTLVSVPVTATIRHGSRTLALSDLSIGDHVEVKGNMAGGMLVATEVKVQQEG